MGRRKPGKPGRHREPLPGLRGMNPPGDLYRKWFHVPADGPIEPAGAARLSDLRPKDHATTRTLAEVYHQHVPGAALVLAELISHDKLFTRDGDRNVIPLPAEQIAQRFARAGASSRPADAGALLHRLHALGMVLLDVEQHGARPLPLLRFTRSTPATGGKWAFLDDLLTAPADMPWMSPGDVRALRAAEEAAVIDAITGGAQGDEAEHLLAEHMAAIVHQTGCVPAGVCTC
jgi:hypothetical protein